MTPGGEGDFLLGVNLPWVTYGCDFGANAWQPGGGVGSPGRLARIETLFARLAARGLRHVRWFALCDGRAGVVIDDRGMPRGLDGFVQRDLDAGVAAASRNGVTLTLVIFDFQWCARPRQVNGVTLGGRRRLLASAPERSALLDRVVRPLLARYGHEPTIVAWDLFNEPEWATFGYGSLNPLRTLWPWQMRAALHELAGAVRAETSQLVTVGLASFRGSRLLCDDDVDLYQVHRYDARSPLPPPLSGKWTGRRVLLGEFPTAGPVESTRAIVRAARERRYCGALGWSALAADEHSQLDALEEAITPRRV